MTIDELVKMGSLKKVTAHRATIKALTAGNKKYTTMFKEEMSPHSPKRMSGGDCQCNSICVVEAMREQGVDL